MTRSFLAIAFLGLACGEVYDAQGSLGVAGTQPVPLGRASSELALERVSLDQAADRVQIAVGDVSVVLSSSLTGPWSSAVEVTFAEGGGSSTPFYVRGEKSGASALTLSSQRMGVRTASVEVSSLLMNEDFEGGDFSIRDLKTWDDPVVQVPSKVELKVDAFAAHRGSVGLIVNDRDTNNGTRDQAEVARLSALFRPFDGDQFVRAWVRVAPTSVVGEAILIAMWRSGFAVYEVNLRLPDGTIEPAGYSSTGLYLRDEPSQPLADGQWHLWELAVLRLGSASAERALWVDGKLVSRRTGLQSAGLQFTNDNLGLPWSNDARFTGTLAFDDVRIGVTAPASQLALTDGRRVGSCRELTVSLKDSVSAAAAPAPYDVDVEVAGLSGRLFEESSCSRAMQKVTITRGATFKTFFVARAQGQRISARHADFLASPELEVAATQGCTTAPGPLMALLAFVIRRRSARARSGDRPMQA